MATTGRMEAVTAIIVRSRGILMSAVIAMSAVMVVPTVTMWATPIPAIMRPGTPMKFTLFLLIFAGTMIITVLVIALIPIVVVADGVATV